MRVTHPRTANLTVGFGAKYRTLAVLTRHEYRSGMSGRIEINPRICGGQPIIKGTRIPVEAILEQLAEDESWDSLLRGYPELTRDDIQAALEYARRSILHTEITALGVAYAAVRLYLDQM